MLIESVLSERRQVLTEMESKALLGAFHVPVTRTVIARSPTEAIVVAEQIGFPIAMKISSVDVTHKSDVGGVVLNVRNAAEVRAQYNEILASVRRARPEARIDGVTLQAMRRAKFGREVYVGVFRDPLFGPVIAFGAGGNRIEVVRDTTLEFPPLNRFLARRMIERTRVAESLGEFRGAPPIDFEQLETLLVRVSEMVCELPWIAEMDVNPVIADQDGVVAVDARIVVDPAIGASPKRYAHLAILPYPADLVQVRSSPDGQFYTIRPIQPEDADRLQAFVRSMSDESRYFRFISTLAELTPKMLVRYTQVDYDRELALVAVVGPETALAGSAEPQEERIVGVVRYLLNPDRDTCEFAVAIADDWQGKRLGSTLMRAIVEAARAKGLKRIEGYVLAANAKMLGLMSYLGFSIQTDREDPTMKIVSMSLG
jgi:acetyltransferase